MLHTFKVVNLLLGKKQQSYLFFDLTPANKVGITLPAHSSQLSIF